MAQTDWRDEARTLLAAGYGQRESARKLGVPEDRLRKWASREGLRSSVTTVVTTTPPALKRVPNVTKASDVMLMDVAELGSTSRLATAQLGAKALPYLARRSAKVILSQVSPGELAAMQQRANIPGWERKESAGSGLNLLVHGQAIVIQGPSAPE